VFYLTSDGGQTWTPVRQGIRFQTDMTVNFVSPNAGFAWNPNSSGAPPIYATTNGGRTWTRYLPQLARGQRQSLGGTSKAGLPHAADMRPGHPGIKLTRTARTRRRPALRSRSR
jgi:hypothetical protein